VISGYGLSAVLFSSIAQYFFPGDTSLLFLVLALGTSLPMIMGFFLIRPIPLPAHEGYDIVEDPAGIVGAIPTARQRRDSSHDRLLDHDFTEPSHPHHLYHDEDPDCRSLTYQRLSDEMQLDAPIEQLPIQSRRPRSMNQGATMSLDLLPNMCGRKLLQSGDFWLLFTIFFMRESPFFVPFHLVLIEQTVSGTGIMCKLILVVDIQHQPNFTRYQQCRIHVSIIIRIQESQI